MFGVKSAQVHEMTVLQMCSGVECIYSFVIITCALAIALSKNQILNRYVSPVIYDCNLTDTVSVINLLLTYTFKMRKHFVNIPQKSFQTRFFN